MQGVNRFPEPIQVLFSLVARWIRDIQAICLKYVLMMLEDISGAGAREVLTLGYFRDACKNANIGAGLLL